MSSLTPSELDRLVSSQRKLNISALVAVVVLVAIVVAMASAGVSFVPGALVGVAIGALLSVPHRRLLNELGLSRQDARAILSAEKKRRKSLH
ncbi:hypothetical protein DMB66_46340 [Actinoplanes sp. ATCC 53533]|uniref:hypothetical protein n=1 Tax=Actinoplanes sp. ATCC 53533 TaxID=1288362 RepID=UPI000F7998D6|nr:hypothetical protein [Actinoplanes sp. ATCC 53533]RSM48401.1 hypothetical protein DMB66_46340 [Actinoplanes sp. ATCC 53533]